MFTHIALLALAITPAPAVRYPLVGDRTPVRSIYRPRIELWTNRGDGAVFTRGERVRMRCNDMPAPRGWKIAVDDLRLLS